MSSLTTRVIRVVLAIVVLAVIFKGAASRAENATVVPLPAVDAGEGRGNGTGNCRITGAFGKP